jgi:hypothetical protein
MLDMQRVLTRILTDKGFQRDFIARSAPPEGYELTERELSSLRGLQWDRVSLDADLIAYQRLTLALHAAPLTSIVLGTQLRARIDRFCADYPPVPRPAGAMFLEGTRLCEFALSLLREGELEPSWAADVVTYERILLTLNRGMEAAESSLRTAVLNQASDQSNPGGGLDWPPPDLGDQVPMTGPHAEIACFAHAVPELVAAIKAGTVPDPVPALDRPLFLLFCRQPTGTVNIAKVNAPTVALVEACDGQSTVTDIVSSLTRQFGAGMADGVIAALGGLRRTGVIGLRGGW